MTTIADSDAFKDADRVLPQHQAALTLLQSMLSAPTRTRVAWLDLACGRGQIISALDAVLSQSALHKIAFYVHDVDQTFLRETMRTAECLGFHSLDSRVGDLARFANAWPNTLLFDFITLNNTVHEIDPRDLGSVLVTCIERLSEMGELFVYDMESVQPAELGAVPWSRNDILQILRLTLDCLGASDYQPEVGRWRHKSCYGWNIHLQRKHLNVLQAEIQARRDEALTRVQEKIRHILKRRLDECRQSLQALTTYGAETVEEQNKKEQLLYDFFALSRALEGRV